MKDSAYRRYRRYIIIARRIMERMTNVRAEDLSPTYWTLPNVKVKTVMLWLIVADHIVVRPFMENDIMLICLNTKFRVIRS